MIERQMKSPDPLVRAHAVEALWSASGSEAIDLMRTALNDESHQVVVIALIGLHKQRVSGAYEKLLALAQHPSDAMCRAAVWGLGQIGDARAVPLLRTLSESARSSVSAEASSVLGKLAPERSLGAEQMIPAEPVERVADMRAAPVAVEATDQASDTKPDGVTSPAVVPPPQTRPAEAPEGEALRNDRSRSSMNILGI